MQEAAAVKGRMTQDMANERDALSMSAVLWGLDHL